MLLARFCYGKGIALTNEREQTTESSTSLTTSDSGTHGGAPYIGIAILRQRICDRQLSAKSGHLRSVWSWLIFAKFDRRN